MWVYDGPTALQEHYSRASAATRPYGRAQSAKPRPRAAPAINRVAVDVISLSLSVAPDPN